MVYSESDNSWHVEKNRIYTFYNTNSPKPPSIVWRIGKLSSPPQNTQQMDSVGKTQCGLFQLHLIKLNLPVHCYARTICRYLIKSDLGVNSAEQVPVLNTYCHSNGNL